MFYWMVVKVGKISERKGKKISEEAAVGEK